MQNSFIIMLFMMLNLSRQQELPDLSSKEDLKALGTGRIIESDHSIITNINLLEVKEYWIIYLKNKSSHDIMMEKIDRLEFRNTEWGPLRIEFSMNKPIISGL